MTKDKPIKNADACYQRAMENINSARVHGNGFLIIDIGEGERLHFWGHPAIPKQTVPSQIHNHRFGFKSTVLMGSIVNIVFAVTPNRAISQSPESRHSLFDEYEAVPRVGEDTVLELRRQRCAVIGLRREILLRRSSYVMQAGEFHGSYLNEPTVTHMVKRHDSDVAFEGNPAVLCKTGHEPDNEFSKHQITKSQVLKVITDTLTLW